MARVVACSSRIAAPSRRSDGSSCGPRRHKRKRSSFSLFLFSTHPGQRAHQAEHGKENAVADQALRRVEGGAKAVARIRQRVETSAVRDFGKAVKGEAREQVLNIDAGALGLARQVLRQVLAVAGKHVGHLPTTPQSTQRKKEARLRKYLFEFLDLEQMRRVLALHQPFFAVFLQKRN